MKALGRNYLYMFMTEEQVGFVPEIHIVDAASRCRTNK
jgi:hypothetical protein